jgi:hypothetical protein
VGGNLGEPREPQVLSDGGVANSTRAEHLTYSIKDLLPGLALLAQKKANRLQIHWSGSMTFSQAEALLGLLSGRSDMEIEWE